MKHPRYLLRGRYRDLIGNVATRLAALVALALATLAVARGGGPAAVGVYVLLRVLPSLVGVVISSGLPGAITYFLAGEYREDRRLPLTVLSMAVAGGITGTLLWAAASPLLGPPRWWPLSAAQLNPANTPPAARWSATRCAIGRISAACANKESRSSVIFGARRCATRLPASRPTKCSTV